MLISSVLGKLFAFPAQGIHNKKQNKLVTASMNRLTRRMRNF